jgi:hypothetical protein
MEITKLIADEKKSTEGVIFDYVVGEDTIKVRLAMAGNRVFNATLQKILREKIALNPSLRENNEEISQEAGIEATAKAIILDIQGLTKDGKPVAYTPDLGIQFLKGIHFRNFVNSNSINLSNFTNEKEAKADASALKSVPQVAN